MVVVLDQEVSDLWFQLTKFISTSRLHSKVWLYCNQKPLYHIIVDQKTYVANPYDAGANYF